MAASLIAGLMQHKSKSDLADQVTHTSSLMEQMPEADAIVYSGQLFKCPFFSSGATWRKVFVCTTEEQLFMSQFETDPNCIDRIPLHEVTQIDKSELKIRVGKEEFQTFDILTKPDGHNQGRKYQFRVAPEKLSGWVNHLNGQTEEAKRLFIEKNRKTLLQQVKIFAKRVHDSDEFQQFFGVVIMLSFAISLVQSEMVPVEGSREDEIFQYLDYVFTGFFTLELIVTFVGHFGLIFFMDSWRIFDTAIVAISLVAASGLKMPAVKSIRAMRVLRAVRLLKKSKSLRPIVEALFASVLPVMNSMVLLGLVTAIYSSMAVGLFGESHPVMFGKLTRAMFTMFQVCTGDGWATDITRELFDENGMTKPVPVVFFVSYMLVASLVLINIIIAVLLDEFLTTMSRSRMQSNKEEVEEDMALTGHCLDPLMAVLSKYRGAADLIESIRLIYMRLDEDGSGKLGMAEVRDGLPKIIPIELTVEDWYHITEDVLKLRQQSTADESCEQLKDIDPLDLELSQEDFHLMCLSQLKSYLLRESNKALAGDNNADDAMLMILKWVMITLDKESDKDPVADVRELLSLGHNKYAASPESAENPGLARGSSRENLTLATTVQKGPSGSRENRNLVPLSQNGPSERTSLARNRSRENLGLDAGRGSAGSGAFDRKQEPAATLTTATSFSQRRHADRDRLSAADMVGRDCGERTSSSDEEDPGGDRLVVTDGAPQERAQEHLHRSVAREGLVQADDTARMSADRWCGSWSTVGEASEGEAERRPDLALVNMMNGMRCEMKVMQAQMQQLLAGMERLNGLR